MKNLVALFSFFCATLFLTSCGSDESPTPAETATRYVESSFVTDCNTAGTNVTVKDVGEGAGNMTWTNDKVYILDGLVFVNDGQELVIEAGTIIKGKSGTAEDASALIVARNGKITAIGTQTDPIVFTSDADILARDNNGDLCAGGNLPVTSKGLWGGVIVLGNATINSSSSELSIEGIPTTETRGLYGGSDDSDDSGTIKYVSIRHGGTNIGANNEINGLTMGAVGNATTIEYVEVIANKDDGFEWFGGTVNTKYLVSAFCGDDAFDFDEGWRGLNQHWIAYQGGTEADNGGEHDGAPSDCLLCDPVSSPTILNATYAGIGTNRAIRFRENCGGGYHNSVFVNFEQGIEISDIQTYNNFATNLEFTNNMLWNVAEDHFVFPEATADQQSWMDTYFANSMNTTATDPGLNLLVPTSAAAMSSEYSNADPFFDEASYKGAFDPAATATWISGWTLIDTEELIQ